MCKRHDNKFDTFRKICNEISEERSYNNKANILKFFFKIGSNNAQFEGDIILWMKMLIPTATQRVYHLQNKQIIKLFSRLFGCENEDMRLHLENGGDVSETIKCFFEKSVKLQPQNESSLYLQDVEDFLINLEHKTKEDDQLSIFAELCQKCTALDLKMIIRLLKQDLRINARASHILAALGKEAYPAYQSSRNLEAVVTKFYNSSIDGFAGNPIRAVKKINKFGLIEVMTPISPMLASACKAVGEAFKKSPGGLYSEIKYDGERVQIHKKGNEFKFFTRNLKPVLNQKVAKFKEIIPKAFPGVGDLILDSEIILVDTLTGALLPFGSLGLHKKKEYLNAEVCLFIFDIMVSNGKDLTNLSFHERRTILEDTIEPIKSYIQLSECHFLKTEKELSCMTAKVFKAKLEGVVLKDPNGTYQPGKRGWLKIKKDYLFGGKMADAADLVVLGGWYGSGKKGGMLSIFLMGCYDSKNSVWKTVTKVHSGLDDATNAEIHDNLMKLVERLNPNEVPKWIVCKKSLLPDYLAKNPLEMPVWEISGAEFTKSETHTASGISIRFPRITKLRNDKTALDANDLEYLQKLYDVSKSNLNVDLMFADCDNLHSSVSVEVESKLSLSPTKKKDFHVKQNVKRNIAHIEEKQLNLKKLKTQNVESGEEIIKKNERKRNNADSDIFEGLISYFTTDFSERIEYERLFDANGGKIAADPKEVNVCFYNSTRTMKTNLKKNRKDFKKTCRHLDVSWITDSIGRRSLASFPLHAIVL